MVDFEFWCPNCNNITWVSRCKNCHYFSEILIKKITLLETCLLEIKNVFDNCEDPDPVLSRVRLNMASAFDTSIECFDDIFCYNCISDFNSFLDEWDLPDQFEVQFFDK